MLPQPARDRKSFPRVCWIPKHGFLCYRNKQTFLVGKNVLIVMVPILTNKHVIEPNYNNLKFTVWNSFVCTNLIQVTKAKINKWDCIKLKDSAQQKIQSTKRKGSLRNERKYFQIIYWINHLYPGQSENSYSTRLKNKYFN